MNRILDVSARDKTCLVEPGVSYFDLYRHLRTNKIPLWIDTADPGWGGLIGNALDRGGGYTDIEFRDHFDAHCGMEVVLPTGEVVRTGMGASPQAKTSQLFKYGLGPWVDGIFSQSNFGIVTKMGFWLMEEPEAALQVSVTVPKRRDVVPLVDTLHSLMCAHTVPSQVNVVSPLMAGNNPEMLRLRGSGGASDEEWDRFAAERGRRAVLGRAVRLLRAARRHRGAVAAHEGSTRRHRRRAVPGDGVVHVPVDRRAGRSRRRQSALRHSVA